MKHRAKYSQYQWQARILTLVIDAVKKKMTDRTSLQAKLVCKQHNEERACNTEADSNSYSEFSDIGSVIVSDIHSATESLKCLCHRKSTHRENRKHR